MINNTRRRWNDRLAPLLHSSELTNLAAEHAKSMAEQGAVFHADATDLCCRLEEQPSLRLGENVIAGEDALDMHLKLLERVGNYANMVDGRFTEVGIASARGANGQYYLCQLFRG